MTPSLAAACAAVEALVGCGVREVVLCPGSRSAPLAYAVRAAERAGRLRLHVRVDERSAAFVALGLATLGGPPAVVVTTSGTAVANLHPAVLEAHHATVPLVVLSADRPAALRGTGANQTTTQPGIFGAVPRAELDLAPGDDVAAGIRAAVAAAVGGAASDGSGEPPSAPAGADVAAPGPVHVNLQLVEPLVPSPEDDLAGWAERLPTAATTTGGPSEGEPPDGPPSPAAPSDGSSSDGPPSHGASSGGAPSELVDTLPARTLVLLGDLPAGAPAGAVLAWAERHGFPVLAEPFGTHPRVTVPHGVVVAADADLVEAHPPECVVVVGRPTLSRPYAVLARRAGVRLVAAHALGQPWSPPGRPVEQVRIADLLDVPAATDPDDAWRATWFAAGEQVERALADTPPRWPSGLRVARELGLAVPADAVLFLGSSNAPRDLDIAMAPRTQALTVVGNRGLAGIDGCVSTATGIALAHPGRPAYALVGDLTLLHDTNALLVGPGEPRPDLTVIVVNDDGGGIFSTLEPGEPSSPAAEDFDRLFGTPTGTRLEPLCAAHGVRHAAAASVEDLRRHVAAPPRGLLVLEVRVDRSRTRADHSAVSVSATGSRRRPTPSAG